MTFGRTICLLFVSFFLSSSVALAADGIDSTAGSDLPIGAGGSKIMTITAPKPGYNSFVGIGTNQTTNPARAIFDVSGTGQTNYYNEWGGWQSVAGVFRGDATEGDGKRRTRFIVEGTTNFTSPSVDLRINDPSGKTNGVHLYNAPNNFFAGWVRHFGIFVGGGLINPDPFIIRTDNGHVGINQPSSSHIMLPLDVNGEVRVGNTWVGCDAAHEGAIRYDAGSKTFLGCDGTNWIPLGGGTPPGTLCGTVFWETDDNANGTAYPCGNIQLFASCQGQPLMNGGAACGWVICPAGYSPVSIGYAWNNNSGSYNFQYHQGSCAKN